MNKISTSVILGIVCIVLLSVLVYLNRDKFGSAKSDSAASGEDATEE